MALLTAYIDDSGTDGNSTTAVAAGFLTDVGKWGQFESEWRFALQRHGIEERGFHMADFNANPKRGVFAGWDDNRGNELLKQLYEAINKHCLIGFSAAVRKSDYDRLVTGRLRDLLGGYYVFVSSVCIWQITRWRHDCGIPLQEPVKYVFARGTEGNNEVHNMLVELRKKWPRVSREHGIVGVPSFESTKTTLPLQAADILAWESTRHLRDWDDSKPFAAELAGVKSIRTKLFNETAFERYVPEVTAKYESANWNAAPFGFI